MGVSIRLLRFSCRKKPFYRVIAASGGTATISRISGKDGSRQMGLNFERVKAGLDPPPPMVAM